MMINKENYEIYAIDFLENNLDKETRSEMIRFLSDHPELKAEIESMMEPSTMIPDHTITFEPKSLLKKEENKKAFWIPALLKFAAAIALLLSISSVWYLNNRINTLENTTATKIDTTTKTAVKKVTPNSNIETETLPITEIKESKSVNEKINKSNTQTIKTSKKINTPIKEPSITESRSNIASTKNTNSSINQPINNYPISVIANQRSKAQITPTTSKKRIDLSIEPVELLAQAHADLSDGSIQDEISIPKPPTITIAEETNKSKGSWLINAITKKSDGTNIFAFEGVKRALTPTRLRDVNVDKASSDSPFKQFTND